MTLILFAAKFSGATIHLLVEHMLIHRDFLAIIVLRGMGLFGKVASHDHTVIKLAFLWPRSW